MLFRKQQKNKRWERRPQLYKGRYYYFKKLGQLCLGILFLLGAISFVSYFRNSETLFIKNIQVVSQNRHVSAQQLIQLSEIKRTDKLFTLDLRNTARNILRHPWIENVQIRREFPDTIQIHAIEKQPVAMLYSDKYYLIDKNGEVFKKHEGESYDLPIIKWFPKKFTETNPRLSKLYYEQVFEFFQDIQNLPFYRDRKIARVHFDPISGITVFTKSSELEVYYGKSDLLDKHRKLEQLHNQEGFTESRFARLDLNTQGRIIARKRL